MLYLTSVLYQRVGGSRMRVGRTHTPYRGPIGTLDHPLLVCCSPAFACEARARRAWLMILRFAMYIPEGTEYKIRIYYFGEGLDQEFGTGI